MPGTEIMARAVTYYYALASPWSYLGGPRLVEIAEHTGATVHYKPVYVPRLFPATGTLALRDRPPLRQAYRLVELKRWRERLGMPLNGEPRFFPVNESRAARMVIVARREGENAAHLTNALMRAVWAEERDIADAPTLVEIASACGLDGAALIEAAEAAEVVAAYEDDTEEAIERGVFGVPSYVLGTEVFWGQDRLDFVQAALAAD